METPNPTRGAAYMIIVERVNPDGCTSRERQAEIETAFTKIDAWAQTQPAEIREAYLWCTDYIRRGIDQRLRQYEISAQIPAIKDTIPRPPEC